MSCSPVHYSGSRGSAAAMTLASTGAMTPRVHTRRMSSWLWRRCRRSSAAKSHVERSGSLNRATRRVADAVIAVGRATSRNYGRRSSGCHRAPARSRCAGSASVSPLVRAMTRLAFVALGGCRRGRGRATAIALSASPSSPSATAPSCDERKLPQPSPSSSISTAAVPSRC